MQHRIKAYITGTQESGKNKYWREQYLTKGDVRLYVLKFVQGKLYLSAGESITLVANDLSSQNVRRVLEPLLVRREIVRKAENQWIVNRTL